MFAEDEAAVLAASARDADDLQRLVARRVAGTPLEHVVGWAEFGGLRVAVGPGVFVPRRRSELLGRVAAAATPADGIVVELCCGAAAISAVIAAAVPTATIYAVDTAPVAVEFARWNLGSANASAYVGDLYSPLPRDLRGRVDVIVANAPYVPTDEIALLPTEARLYEPRAALDGGADGTAIQRRIAHGAPKWLALQGVLLVETSTSQVALTCAHFEDAGLDVRVRSDEELGAVVVVGFQPG